MRRAMLCHEEHLLRRFSQCLFDDNIEWGHDVLKDELWGQDMTDHSPSLFNVSFLSVFSTEPWRDSFYTKVAQIHPAYLTPAVFVVADKNTRNVHSFELMNGEATHREEFQMAILRIEEFADKLEGRRGFSKSFAWWRIFAMFDCIFFFATTAEFHKSIAADRKGIDLPLGMHGACQGLYVDRTLIGLEGWYNQPTGFGAESII